MTASCFYLELFDQNPYFFRNIHHILVKIRWKQWKLNEWCLHYFTISRIPIIQKKRYFFRSRISKKNLLSLWAQVSKSMFSLQSQVSEKSLLSFRSQVYSKRAFFTSPTIKKYRNLKSNKFVQYGFLFFIVFFNFSLYVCFPWHHEVVQLETCFHVSSFHDVNSCKPTSFATRAPLPKSIGLQRQCALHKAHRSSESLSCVRQK